MAEEAKKPADPVAPEVTVEVEIPKQPVEDKITVTQSVSFKEETNVVAELPEAQKKALQELKLLIQEALNKNDFTSPPPAAAEHQQNKPLEEKPAETATETQTVTVTLAEAFKEEEEKPAPASQEPKIEVEKAKSDEPPKAESETVTSAASDEEKKEEQKEAVVVVTEAVKKVADVHDDDGARTVEAIQESIVSVSTETKTQKTDPAPVEEVLIWGIPLLADERSDVILLKFLRARDFRVKEAFAMIKKTVRWRKEFGIEKPVEEDDVGSSDWEKVVFTHGHDKEGHPVCYNVFGELEKKELYERTFSDEEKRERFIRWRIQVLEKSVRKFDYSPTGVCSIVQVNDFNNSPGLVKRELRQATNQALHLLQDNYPEFVAKQVFINVPWWYLAFHRIISPFLTQRTKSKFVFAAPSKSAETLFKYIAPEQVPVQFGGLSREGDQDFTTSDPVTEVTIRPATKHAVVLPVSEASHVVWEVRVVGWDVSYGAEFVPSAEDGYTVIVQKSRKIGPADESVISDSFKNGEPGKVVLTIDNRTSKKKKLLYRSKTKLISH